MDRVFLPEALEDATGANQGGVRGPPLCTAMERLRTMAQTETKIALVVQAETRQKIGGHPHDIWASQGTGRRRGVGA